MLSLLFKDYYLFDHYISCFPSKYFHFPSKTSRVFFDVLSQATFL